MSVDETEFALGDRIAFDLPTGFLEQGVTTLQENNRAVGRAARGMRVGLKTSLTKSQAREGVRVYRVVRAHNGTAANPDSLTKGPEDG